MSEINLEEFKKLSDGEKRKRYKDMSNEDKYQFRITDPDPFLNAKTVGYVEMTEEKEENEIKRKETIEATQRNKENNQ